MICHQNKLKRLVNCAWNGIGKTRRRFATIYEKNTTMILTTGKKTTDYQRERYRTSRTNAIKLKPGRKPRSTSNSSDEAASPSQPIIKCRGRPRLHEVDEN